MRKVGALLLVVLGVAAASAGAAPSIGPTIRLVERTPVTVRGTGFETQERVRVILIADSRSAQVTRAGVRGGFVVRFNRSLPSCVRFSLLAIGSNGNRARLLPARISIDCSPND